MLQTGRERGQRDGKPSSVRMMLSSQRCTQTICSNLKRKDFCRIRFSASKNGDDDGDEKSSSTSGFLTTLLCNSSGFCSLASKDGKERSKRCPCRVSIARLMNLVRAIGVLTVLIFFGMEDRVYWKRVLTQGSTHICRRSVSGYQFVEAVWSGLVWSGPVRSGPVRLYLSSCTA